MTDCAWWSSQRRRNIALPKDMCEAARLFKLAADQGSARAQDSLTLLFANGLGGLTKDERKAVRLWKLAADQGHAGARYSLGIFYRGDARHFDHARGDRRLDDCAHAEDPDSGASLGRRCAQNRAAGKKSDGLPN
jgi:TPR repeat protein